MMTDSKRDNHVVQVQRTSKKKSCSLLETLDEYFKTQFRRLGVTIGRHPWYFITVPLAISLLLGSGLLRFSYVNDPEYLFAPFHGDAKEERSTIERHFPMNYSNRFNPSRILKPGRATRILVMAKDGGNLLRNEIWKEMRELDEFVRGVRVDYGGQEFNYTTLCAKWEGQCFENDILELADMMEEVESGNASLLYPVMLNPATFKTYVFPLFFGGMELSNSSTIDFVKAYVTIYFANVDTPEQEERGFKWEGALLSSLDEMDSHWKHIDVYRLTWRSIGEEIDQNLLSSLKFIPIAATLMIAFAAGTMMSRDWIRAKPWLGVAGILTTVMGTLAGFGLISWTGVPLISINIAGVFLNLGIGIDDSFVMLAAWRRTSVKDSVPKRMGDAYAEAAVSITITSLTDMFSFWVGVAAPFHSVRIFCLYTGTAVVGTYLFHVTIFGAAMALSGYHEAKGRHGLFFWRRIASESRIDYADSSASGSQSSLKYDPVNSQDYGLMPFFRDYWAYYINKPIVKVGVMVLFVVYLGVAGWGISKTEEGLALGKLSIYGSYAQKYFQVEDEYFRKFPYRIQVVITGDVEYSNKTVQENIEKMMRQLEESKYVGSDGSLFTESWLRSFLRYAESLKAADLELDLKSEKAFIRSLKDNYLVPSSIYSEDVKFNEDGSKILAARFVIQSVNISDSNVETEMVKELRAIVQEHSPQLNVTLFNYYFIYFDQYLIIRSTTIKSIVVTGLIMMVLSLVFIPNPLCSLWVAFSIVSIATGVGGFLVLWNVNLDVVSMLCLIMCIGLSVDFSVHISYAYISSKAETPEERVKACLESLGMAIVQGAVSTLLGIFSIFFAPSYILSTFCKSVTLVMIISAAHGLLLLPVLLSIFGPGSCKSTDKQIDKTPEFEGQYRKSQGFDNAVFVPERNGVGNQHIQCRL